MSQVELKSRDEIALMRDAGRIVSEILEEIEKAVEPGGTTWELDALSEKLVYQKDARPTFKGYHGFPACRGFFGDSARTVLVGKSVGTSTRSPRCPTTASGAVA